MSYLNYSKIIANYWVTKTFKKLIKPNISFGPLLCTSEEKEKFHCSLGLIQPTESRPAVLSARLTPARARLGSGPKNLGPGRESVAPALACLAREAVDAREPLDGDRTAVTCLAPEQNRGSAGCPRETLTISPPSPLISSSSQHLTCLRSIIILSLVRPL